MTKFFDRTKFGVRVRAVREAVGLSQQKFSNKCGIGQSTLANVELGNNTPGVDLLLQIWSANPNIDLGWLLTGDGEMTSGIGASPRTANPPSSLVVEDELVRELQELRELATRSSQSMARKLINALRAAVEPISRHDLARACGEHLEDISADINLLRRVGLIGETPGGLVAATPGLKAMTPADSAELALEVIDIILRRVLPAADKADGSGWLIRVEAAVSDNARVMEDLRELIRSRLERDAGDQWVTIVLGITRSAP